MAMNGTVMVPRIESRIQMIRGLRVIVDVDLAALYGVPTKRLNEQVKRNRERFPADFLFQLTANEKAEVVANCDHLQRLKFSRTQPHAFTEHGAIQAHKNAQSASFNPRTKVVSNCDRLQPPSTLGNPLLNE